MRPMELLKHEHRVIEQVLDCLAKMIERCGASGRLEPEPARAVIDFFRNFADGCHHAKEEDQLFPMMEQRGFSPDNGPTAVMRAEHEQGRRLIAGMEQAIDGAAAADSQARESWLRNARGYVAMLREHINKEDHCLFPMADQALSAEEQTLLGERFDRVEREEAGASTHDKYVRLADELADRYGVAKHRATSAHS